MAMLAFCILLVSLVLPVPMEPGTAVTTVSVAADPSSKNRCENCDVETVPGKKHEKGVTPPRNETQVDHKLPKAKGGPGDVDNAQVLCRDCNLKKGSKEPGQEEAP